MQLLSLVAHKGVQQMPKQEDEASSGHGDGDVQWMIAWST
jgi:hypothetical protein